MSALQVRLAAQSLISLIKTLQAVPLDQLSSR